MATWTCPSLLRLTHCKLSPSPSSLRPGRFCALGSDFFLTRASAAAYSLVQPLHGGNLVQPGRRGQGPWWPFLFSGSDQASRQLTYSLPRRPGHNPTDVPQPETAVIWLVLRSAYASHHLRLHSERKWLEMDRHQRFGWDIVKRCETRADANQVLDELRAAAEKAESGGGGTSASQ
jgi:hypothetical protein